MKKIIFLVALFINSLVFINAQDSNPFNYVGIEHNKGLDFAYNLLMNKKKSGNLPTTRTEAIALVKEILNEFNENSEILRNYKYANDISSKAIVKLQEQNSINTELDNSLNNGYSIEFNNILKQIIQYSKTFDTNSLNGLMSEIKKVKIEKERDFLYIELSIAYNTSLYWKSNYEKWQEINPQRIEAFKFSWGEVGANDVAYGIAGGLAGALFGGSVSFGILTIPGWVAGVIGGAITGSVGNAILQVFGY